MDYYEREMKKWAIGAAVVGEFIPGTPVAVGEVIKVNKRNFQVAFADGTRALVMEWGRISRWIGDGENRADRVRLLEDGEIIKEIEAQIVARQEQEDREHAEAKARAEEKRAARRIEKARQANRFWDWFGPIYNAAPSVANTPRVKMVTHLVWGWGGEVGKVPLPAVLLIGLGTRSPSFDNYDRIGANVAYMVRAEDERLARGIDIPDNYTRSGSGSNLVEALYAALGDVLVSPDAATE